MPASITDQYRALRATGLGVSEAVSALRKQGVNFHAACDASWLVETGKPKSHPDDYRANAAWERGATRRFLGDHLERGE